jgi:5-methylcytosine-specific restriction protein A
MPTRAKKPCAYQGCASLVDGGERYCEKHRKKVQQQVDEHRGSANDRGYTYRWRKYSLWFLRQPENVMCKLQLDGCTKLSECVDHIDPPNGADDPRFWDTDNHQGACIHCNSVKGHRKMEGTPRGV